MSFIKKTKYFLLITVLIVFALPVKGQGNAVILTWSTDTYIPVNYPGKALPTLNSKVEIAAVVDNSIDSQKATYIWSFFRNHHLQKKVTEKGKQTFSFDIGDNIYHIYSVQLEIQDDQNNVIGKSETLSIKPVEPEIILRPNQKAILFSDSSDLKLKKYQVPSNQTIEFTATPYFFNIYDINELSYDWSFGRKKASLANNLNNPNIFELKINEVAEIISQALQLDVNNKNNPLQKASAQAQLILVP